MIKCPRCGKETELKDNPFRPFCSERCKLIDLGNWISENYSIPPEAQDEEEGNAPASDGHSRQL